MELIVARDAPTEKAQFITKQKDNLPSHWHLQVKWQLTVPQSLPETQPSKTLR
jgi:hypothetical protein